MLSSLAVLVLLIDSFCYQAFRFHLNTAVLELFFGPASREIFPLSAAFYLKAAALGVVVMFLQWCAASLVQYLAGISQQPPAEKSRLDRKFSSSKRSKITWSLILLLIISSNLVYSFADAVSYVPITQQTDVLPYFPRITLRSFLGRMGISTNFLPNVAPESTGNLRYPLQELRCHPPAKPKNVIFLAIDSWRYDMLSQELTPTLEQFAGSSMRFVNHFAGGSATRSGVFSLFYAIPSRYWQPMLAERRGPVFIKELQKAGYQFGIFASAPLNSPEFDRTVFSDLSQLLPPTPGKEAWQRDVEITKRFKDFLLERDPAKPFFSFLFYDSPHAFSLPPDFPRRFTPSDDEPDWTALRPNFQPEKFYNLYRNTLVFVDGLIGEVINKLREQDLLDSTIIVITGDHGQEFNEHGLNYWLHNGNYSRLQVGVPLLVSWPGRPPAQYTHWSSHFDIVPTILQEEFSCENDLATYSVGRNLFDSSPRSFLLLGNYNDSAIVESNRITVIDGYGHLRVTDAELHPSADQQPSPAIISSVMEQLRRFFQ